MRETIRSGGRRGILGGHYGSRRKDEKSGRDYDAKAAEIQLDKLVEKETREEVLWNWRTMQSRVIIPPCDSDELFLMPVWDRRWDEFLLSWY